MAFFGWDHLNFIMKIIMSGASGLVGSAIVEALTEAGHEVQGLRTPRPAKKDADREEAWQEAVRGWTPETFNVAQALLCFGGEPIYGLWTKAKRRRIINSRFYPCRAMAEAAAGMEHKPKVIVAASATGFYGDSGDSIITETSPRGNGFLAETTDQWESAWEPARVAGIRVVTVRLGVVLTLKGGALKLMLPVFRMGLGGVAGSGKQWFSWISLEDVARMAAWTVDTPAVSGPVNGTSPEPVTNYYFTKALGAVISRPTVLTAPKWFLKALAGNVADETVLASSRVVPEYPIELGFKFSKPSIKQALAEIK